MMTSYFQSNISDNFEMTVLVYDSMILFYDLYNVVSGDSPNITFYQVSTLVVLGDSPNTTGNLIQHTVLGE